MSCNCTNTTTETFTITKVGSSYTITQDGGGASAGCGGTLNVTPDRGFDCIRLVFNYDESSANDELLPLVATGSCPCETDYMEPGGNTQQFIGRFEVPEELATCSYAWTLTANQPPCRIDIVIHAP